MLEGWWGLSSSSEQWVVDCEQWTVYTLKTLHYDHQICNWRILLERNLFSARSLNKLIAIHG